MGGACCGGTEPAARVPGLNPAVPTGSVTKSDDQTHNPGKPIIPTPQHKLTASVVWQCPECNFANEGKGLFCGMCKADKPTDVGVATAAAVKPVLDRPGGKAPVPRPVAGIDSPAQLPPLSPLGGPGRGDTLSPERSILPPIAGQKPIPSEQNSSAPLVGMGKQKPTASYFIQKAAEEMEAEEALAQERAERRALEQAAHPVPEPVPEPVAKPEPVPEPESHNLSLMVSWIDAFVLCMGSHCAIPMVMVMVRITVRVMVRVRVRVRVMVMVMVMVRAMVRVMVMVRIMIRIMGRVMVRVMVKVMVGGQCPTPMPYS